MCYNNDSKRKETQTQASGQGRNREGETKMTTYKITYHPTGRPTAEDKVLIWDVDFKEYGVEESGLIGAVKTFEAIASRNWGTYETMYAITDIKVSDMH